MQFRSLGVCRGWLCKLIDNLMGSDKTLARVHSMMIRAHPLLAQHATTLIRKSQETFVLKWVWQLCVWTYHTNTHTQDRVWAVITHFGFCQWFSRPCWALQQFHFLPVPSYHGNSKGELRYHQMDRAAKLFLSPLPHLSASYNQGTECPHSFHTAAGASAVKTR